MTKSKHAAGTNHTVRSRRRVGRLVAIALAGLVGVGAIVLFSDHPRSDRPWVPQQAVMPRADVHGDSVVIHRLRNFSYTAEEEFTPAYEDRSYDLTKLETVWFVVTPFSRAWRGPAHTFVSFGFADSQYVGISVEARRERGETYSPITGLFRHFELMYVIGDERDLIGSRAAFGDYDVYVYPIRASRERIRALFTEMLARANALAERPEFYNTITNNCTSNVVDHVNHIVPHAVPHGIKIVFPGYADEVAYSLGLIDNYISLEEARRRYRVNDQAQRFAHSPEFSRRIRSAN